MKAGIALIVAALTGYLALGVVIYGPVGGLYGLFWFGVAVAGGIVGSLVVRGIGQ